MGGNYSPVQFSDKEVWETNLESEKRVGFSDCSTPL